MYNEVETLKRVKFSKKDIHSNESVIELELLRQQFERNHHYVCIKPNIPQNTEKDNNF